MCTCTRSKKQNARATLLVARVRTRRPTRARTKNAPRTVTSSPWRGLGNTDAAVYKTSEDFSSSSRHPFTTPGTTPTVCTLDVGHGFTTDELLSSPYIPALLYIYYLPYYNNIILLPLFIMDKYHILQRRYSKTVENRQTKGQRFLDQANKLLSTITRSCGTPRPVVWALLTQNRIAHVIGTPNVKRVGGAC